MTAETIRAASGVTFGIIRAVLGTCECPPGTVRCDGHAARRKKHCLQQDRYHGKRQDSKPRECGSSPQSSLGYSIPRTYSIPHLRVQTEVRLWRNSRPLIARMSPPIRG